MTSCKTTPSPTILESHSLRFSRHINSLIRTLESAQSNFTLARTSAQYHYESKMTSHLDDAPDIPPPPYSETDIYSNPDSHGHSPILSQSQILPAHHRTPSHNNSNSVPVMDDASSAASTSEVIYTPPLSPSSPQSQSYNSGTNLLSPRHAEQQQNTVSVSSDHLTSASAEAYFESRPAPASSGGDELQVTHTIVVKADSSPDDFPYRRDWASFDVKEEDWQTFLNYLLPNHATQRNEAVIDRKLRAEGMDTDDAKSAHSNKSEKSAANAAVEERTPIEAQLDQMRTPDLQQRQDIEHTVREWNDGFFGPRGIVIKVDENATLNDIYRVPGAWDQSFNNGTPDLAGPGTPPVDRRANNSGPSGPPRQPDNTGRWRRFNPMNRFDNSSNGLNIRGVSIDSNSVSIGRNFVANPNGLRIGDVVMDNNGVRIGGRDLFGGGRTASPPAGQPAAPFAPMPPLPQGYSHDQQAYYTRMPPPPPGFPTPPPAPGFDTHGHDEYPNEKAEERTRGPDRHHGHHHDYHHGRGFGHGGGRGRGPGRFSNGASHRHRSRSSSSSSSGSSSSSSSSSSGSDSDTLSIGSLPDYDELKDSQLPVAKTYLEEWLSRPENFVTRETVKEAREEIKAARRTAPQDISDPVERDAMRQQVRGMMGQWRVLKKEQRAARRQRKKDRRARRRAEKKERRQARRERKRSRREARREGRQARRESRGGRRGGRRDHDHDHDAGHHSHSGQGPFGHHGGPGPFGVGHHGGFSPFGGRGGGPFSLGGRDFPGAGFGPGARQRRGGPQGPFQTGPLPCGGPGGAFSAGAPGNWGEGFSRSMADWSRRMGEWSRDFSAPRPGGPGADQPRFPGSWPADVEDHRQDKEAAGLDGQQEAGIQPRDNNGGPHAVSAAMYSSLEAKREALQDKRDALANFSGDSQGEDSQGHKQAAPSLVGMLAEIEELERAVSKLGMDADEQFAKELAALED